MPSPDDPPELPGAPDPGTNRGAATAVGARSNGHGAGHPPPAGPDLAGTDLAGAGRRPPGPSTKPALIVRRVTLRALPRRHRPRLLSGSQAGHGHAHEDRHRAAVWCSASPPAGSWPPSHRGGATPRRPARRVGGAQGATPIPTSATDRGVELYDRSLQFTVAATQQDVITLLRGPAPSQHWKRSARGRRAGGDQT